MFTKSDSGEFSGQVSHLISIKPFIEFYGNSVRLDIFVRWQLYVSRDYYYYFIIDSDFVL